MARINIIQIKCNLGSLQTLGILTTKLDDKNYVELFCKIKRLKFINFINHLCHNKK